MMLAPGLLIIGTPLYRSPCDQRKVEDTSGSVFGIQVLYAAVQVSLVDCSKALVDECAEAILSALASLHSLAADRAASGGRRE